MTTQSSPYPRIEYLIDRFSDWLKHRRELNEMRQLDRTEYDRIAADLEISPGDLDELVRRGPHAADELSVLLRELGIDEAALERTNIALLRDMERVCSLCQHKARCDHDIAVGTSPEHFASYCPNASTLKELDRGRIRGTG